MQSLPELNFETARTRTNEHKPWLGGYLVGDQAHKEAMEKRYGKGQLRIMSEGFQSEACKLENSKSCPRCSAPIQKSGAATR